MYDDDTLLADLRPVRRALSSGGAIFPLPARPEVIASRGPESLLCLVLVQFGNF